MIFADKLIMGIPLLPVGATPPSSYTTQTIHDLSNSASYEQGVFTESGWYRVKIGAADADSGDTQGRDGKGGYASTIFYAYSGTKYLLWGCNGRATGFPWPYGNAADGTITEAEDGDLGGAGGMGSNRTFTYGGTYNPSTGHTTGGTTVLAHGGPGGGSATGNGGLYQGTTVTWNGGAGAGFICGVDFMGAIATTETEAYTNANYSIDNILAMVLAGGGGSWGSSAGGGGGGAYGDGGNGYDWHASGGTVSANCAGGTGSDPTFGRGTDGLQGTVDASGTHNGNGGDGGWCIRNYTTNTFSSGTGVNSRPAAQVCILEKLIY